MKNTIKVIEDPVYRIFVKDDGTDYQAIWRAVLENSIPDSLELKKTRKRDVRHLKTGGRGYIYKLDLYQPKHWENKLWEVLRGHFHSRQMRAVNRAVNQGCDLIPDIFLVAEKKGGLICREAHILMEYIDGRPLEGTDGYAGQREELSAVLARLHSYDLSLGDANPSNFLQTDQGIKIIDLSWYGLASTGKAKDAVAAKKYFAVDLPVQGVPARLAYFYIVAKRRLRAALQRLRGKPPRPGKAR